MRMKKWKKILLWVASIIVILGVGGLFAANYAVDKMISSLADSLETEILEETIAEPTDTPNSGTEDIKEPDQTETNATETANNGTAPSETIASSTDAQYKAEVSLDKAKNVQEEITVGEKAQLTSVFLKQLSIDDIKLLQALASGGLSVEEKKKARTLILEKLTSEQYDELIQIAKKYGMSQGKSYDQVSKE